MAEPMLKIRTYNSISARGLERLPRERYEVASEIQNPDAILLRSQDLHEMDVPAALKCVGRAGAGVNNIPVEMLGRHGVPVFNTPGANANAVKELVIAGMLMAARNLHAAAAYVSALRGSDAELEAQVEAGKKKYVGSELPGRYLGVVGLGAIGVRVANAAHALGMRVLGYDPAITVQRAWQLDADVEQAGSVDELLARADFVSFHVPLMDSTRGLVDTARLVRMKSHAVIMNFARAGIVDDAAVCAALADGRLHAYVTDFPSARLIGHPGVIALPHLGASTREAEENCAIMVVDQVRDYLEHGNITNSVNFPPVRLARAGEYRLGVVNANRPDMVGQISHELGKAEVNIEHMLNESRGELAYTLIDTDKPVPEPALDAIQRIDGVLKVRCIYDNCGD